MKKIPFYKMQGSGNDFILIDNRRDILKGKNLKDLAVKVCHRHYSVGADGLIVIVPSKKLDFKWRFFNADGSEAGMCGIGYEFTKLLARDCKILVLVARNRDKLAEVKRELETVTPVSVFIVEKDLAKQGAADEIYRELNSKNISVDILINNAGFGDNGAFSETDLVLEEKMIAVNILALTQMTKLFVKGMVERKNGKVLNVASTAAFQPGPYMAVYYASKAYVLSFSEAIASELRGTGVTVTVLCPGPTDTGFASVARLEHTRLFTFVKPASAADVARFGYEAMQSGKNIAIHGTFNKIMAFSTRMAPRKLILVFTRLLNEKAH